MFGSFRNASVLGKRFTTGTTPSPTFRSPVMPLTPSDPEDEREDIPGYDANRYFDEQERIRKSRGPALTAYQQALEEQPGAETNPSRWRRFGAALTGAAAGFAGGPEAGFNTASAINESPYRRAMEDYKNRVGGLRESAKLEQDEIESQLKSLREARAMGLKYDEYKLKVLETELDRRIKEGTLSVAERNAETNRLNAGTNRFTAETGRKSQEQTGRHYQNQDVTAAHLGSVTERNVESQIADRAEKNAIAREALQNRLEVEAIRSGRRTPASPDAQQDAIDGALREMYADPVAKRYITLDANGVPHPVDDDGTSNYRKFHNQMIEKAHRRLITGLPFGPTAEEGEFEILPDEPGASW